MESNFERPNALGDRNVETVSPDEASQALAALAADQTLIRAAARPPQWYYPSFSLCLGLVVAVNGAIPDRWIIGRIAALILIAFMEGVFFGSYQKVRKVKFGLTQSMTARSIPTFLMGFVGVALVLVMDIPSVRGLFPWWVHVCLGVIVAVGLYAAARFADR